MKTQLIKSIVITAAVSLASVAQSANFVPEEPYANFAISQNLNESGMAAKSMEMAAMPKAMNGREMLYWADWTDTNK